MISDLVPDKSAPAPSHHVNFLIAGVQKAGTSSLYQLLKRHPAVGLSSVKEVHFFDDESLDWSKPPYERFHSYFPKRRRAIAWGEATPIYSYWPNALERIKAYRPDMKLVLLFRDPISRAYSAWSHQRRRGREPCHSLKPFATAEIEFRICRTMPTAISLMSSGASTASSSADAFGYFHKATFLHSTVPS